MGLAPWNPQIRILSHYFNRVWGDLITTLACHRADGLYPEQHSVLINHNGRNAQRGEKWFSETGSVITPSTNTFTVHATWAEGRLMPVDGRDGAATR